MFSGAEGVTFAGEMRNAALERFFAQGGREDGEEIVPSPSGTAASTKGSAFSYSPPPFLTDSLSSITVRYYACDHLGTPRLIMDEQGAVLERRDFEPFGVQLEPHTPAIASSRFTVHERDEVTTYDYMHFRYYGGSLGRFMKPDNVLGSPANPQSWSLYSYVQGNPVNGNDPTGHALVQLGQHTDDKIKDRLKAIKQELKNKDLTKEQKAALKNEKSTLQTEREGNRVVGNMLAALDKTGQRNGLTLSNFTLTTDTRADFAGKATPQGMDKLMGSGAFVLDKNTGMGGTIFVRTEPENGFYQQSQSNSDYVYFGASALSHEQIHLGGAGEYPAFRRQDEVFHGFRPYFQSPQLYSDLDKWIHEEITANAN
ncbi:MAG: RHS repeat domain-containing protein [Acidobacteriota bacterium]